MTHKKSCVILFAKHPQKGQVKTRIAKTMGHDFAYEFYCRLLRDSLHNLRSLGLPALISISPSSKIEEFRLWSGTDREFLYTGQRGRDLGERMANAFFEAFGLGFEDCILIGSDLPGLPPAIIARALNRLKKKDIVIGPAADGGYYLIGFRKQSFCPAVFEGIRWSGASVFSDTVAACLEYGLEHQVVDQWSDADTLADLAAAVHRKDDQPARSSTALQFIKDRRHAIIAAKKKGSDRR
jgi:rSAM/selenodomain-associated transferase 1